MENSKKFRTKNKRFIENPMFNNNQQLHGNELFSLIKDNFPSLIEKRFKKIPAIETIINDSLGRQKNDHSFYTGSAGNLYLYWRYYVLCKTKYKSNLEMAFKLLNTSYTVHMNVIDNKNDDISFFMGNIGLYTFGCIIADISNNKNLFDENLSKIINICSNITPDTEDEILYGKAGALYSLLLILQECKLFDFSLEEQIANLTQMLIDEGLSPEATCNGKNILLYSFTKDRNHYYLGAVHGLSGILYMLIKVLENVTNIGKYIDVNRVGELIINSLESITIMRFKSGNIPSSTEAEHDDLVQFCHGSTGSIYAFIEALKYFKDKSYEKYIFEQANVIWERGILLKGFGICHGISGSVYALLAVYKFTSDSKYLHQALYFANLYFNKEIKDILADHKERGRKVQGKPDRPDSLMEGHGGYLTLLCDLLNDPENYLFPGFELN